MCICKDRHDQTCSCQDNHENLVITHKHPLLSRLRKGNHSRPTGCLGKHIILSMNLNNESLLTVLLKHRNSTSDWGRVAMIGGSLNESFIPLAATWSGYSRTFVAEWYGFRTVRRIPFVLKYEHSPQKCCEFKWMWYQIVTTAQIERVFKPIRRYFDSVRT